MARFSRACSDIEPTNGIWGSHVARVVTSRALGSGAWSGEVGRAHTVVGRCYTATVRALSWPCTAGRPRVSTDAVLVGGYSLTTRGSRSGAGAEQSCTWVVVVVDGIAVPMIGPIGARYYVVVSWNAVVHCAINQIIAIHKSTRNTSAFESNARPHSSVTTTRSTLKARRANGRGKLSTSPFRIAVRNPTAIVTDALSDHGRCRDFTYARDTLSSSAMTSIVDLGAKGSIGGDGWHTTCDRIGQCIERVAKVWVATVG